MIEILPLKQSHWDQVRTIYEEGLLTGNATFQTSAPQWEEWDESHIKTCRIVANENGNIIGWAALSPVSSRCVYGGVAEISIYVSEKTRGKGIGKKLLKSLIEESEANGFWTLQAGIFPENKASINVHEANEFKIIGKREKIGKMNGVWRDTLLLERRSTIVGL